MSNLESLPDAPTPSESSSATSGNREAEAESAEGDQKALLSANATAVSSQASSPDTRVGQSLHSAQQTPTGSSAVSVSLSSQREQQQAFDIPSGSSETHVQQQTEEKDRSGQRGASAYDESSSTDDDSSPLEVGTSEVDEPSGTSTSSPHSLSTSVSQARPQNVENETGVRRRASGNATYAQAGRSASSPAAGQDDHHLFRSSVARSSSSPSRRSLMVLDGAIVMLLVWVGALVTRKLL